MFHFFRVVLFCQPQLFGNPLHMGIHHNAWLVENIAADNICRLAPDSRQRRQLLQPGGDLASMQCHQPLTAGNDIFRFIMIKTGRADILLQLF